VLSVVAPKNEECSGGTCFASKRHRLKPLDATV
jgi:hypothetical protein